MIPREKFCDTCGELFHPGIWDRDTCRECLELIVVGSLSEDDYDDEEDE